MDIRTEISRYVGRSIGLVIGLGRHLDSVLSAGSLENASRAAVESSLRREAFAAVRDAEPRSEAIA